ncbi:uncharacterized protein LOC116918315 isoform X1 [Daphnia magna]|nr:uncharacterized protein LOC116918315 isoform X1 [Daphnia magna]XP_045027427.1 uncharacterized protein LOC116918315 isoform X1 [Daphnia magna]
MPKCMCCVRFCNSSNFVENKSKLHFFSWPKDENVVETWLKEFSDNSFVTGFSKYFKVTNNLRICSLHFEAKFVNENTKKLIKNAIPTIFQLPTHHSTKACTTTTNVDRTPLTNRNGRLKCVPSIKVTSSDKTGSSFFARDLHSTSTNSNSISGDVGYDFSLLSEATSDTTLDSFGHDLDQNGRSTSHSNVLQGDLELSLLSGTTSDITLDSFGHDLDQNGRSTSNSNNLGGDLQLSLLSATTGDTTVNSFGHDFDKNGRSTPHSNALAGDLDMSLLSATTSDKTLDSFGHALYVPKGITIVSSANCFSFNSINMIRMLLVISAQNEAHKKVQILLILLL